MNQSYQGGIYGIGGICENMVNTRAKGNRNQNKCITFLEKQGCLVDVVEKKGKFIKQKDMFSLFDLVSVHRDGGVCFVQVTSTRPHTHKPYLEFSKEFHKTGVIITQFVWINYKGFKVFTYKNGEKIVEKV